MKTQDNKTSSSHLSDIAALSAKLENKIDIRSIQFSQCLQGEPGTSENDLIFVKYMYGIHFYTSASALQGQMMLRDDKLPVYVMDAKSSKRLYQIG